MKNTYCDVCGGPHKSHMFGRIQWACKTARRAKPGSFTARCRLLWHDFIVHGIFDKGTERCQACGKDYDWYNVPNEEWNVVMGGPGGLLCYSCFLKRR